MKERTGVQSINNVFNIVDKVENVFVYTHIFNLIDNVEYFVYALYRESNLLEIRANWKSTWMWMCFFKSMARKFRLKRPKII